MPELTKEAGAALARADECIKNALNSTEAGSLAQWEMTAQAGILEAIHAVCYEIAALRETTQTKRVDIDHTIRNK